MKFTSLPQAPVIEDVWDKLKGETRPLVVWGMGNGADKLLLEFEKRGLEASDFMASDGFVRGQSFHGKVVLSYGAVKEKYEDFVLVLAFASSREEVLELMFQRAEECTLYMPDLPVCGEQYFDKTFYNAHFEEFQRVYDLLADQTSKDLYAAMLWYKLTGDITILREAYTEAEETKHLLSPKDISVYVDLGAYNGDTLKGMISMGAPLTHAICVEPDKRTFKKLSAYAETLEGIRVDVINAAVWDTCDTGVFEASGNRNSSISNPSHQHRTQEVSLVTVDSLCEGVKPDYIKYDVEGSEAAAILGSALTFRHRPKTLISLYHRSEDLYALPLLFLEQNPTYRLYIRRPKCVPAWEINLIALPNG